VRAVASNNGNFMVLIERSLASPHHASLNVLRKEPFINGKDKLAALATYWTDWTIWSVVLDDTNQMRNEPSCPLPLISDDGELMILLQTGPAFADDGVLRIYRRRDHPGDPMREGPDHGVLIRNIALKDLWPPEKAKQITGWTDETPQWFAGGAFEFSPDSRELIVITRWSNVVHIKLEDGSVVSK
jgi:hypothetical protein